MITYQKVGQSELVYHPLNIMPDKMLLCALSVYSICTTYDCLLPYSQQICITAACHTDASTG